MLAGVTGRDKTSVTLACTAVIAHVREHAAKKGHSIALKKQMRMPQLDLV